MTEIPFGKAFRAKYYSFDQGFVPINHGSYGCPPTPVLEAYEKIYRREQAFPDRYLRYEGLNLMESARKEVAELVKADVNNLAFVMNATTGVNAVLRSYPFQKGDKILIQSTVYGACGNTVKFLQNRIGIEIVVVDLTYPMEDKDVVQLFKDCFEKSKIKLAMFDAVSSMPGVRIPFEKLVSLCKEYGVLSLVDGAHSVGLIPLDLATLKPDFYTSNLHKWLSTPRGCAFLYVDAEHHRHIHTFPISHSYLDDSVVLPDEKEKTRFVDRFAWTGSMTLAQFVASHDAIKFRKEICGGEDRIREHNFSLAKEASEYVKEAWKSELLDNSTGTLLTSMFTIEFPLPKQLLAEMSNTGFFILMLDIVLNKMIESYKTFIPMALHKGKCFARFSCEVYNELEDYKYGAEVFPKVIKEFLDSPQYGELKTKFFPNVEESLDNLKII